MRTLAKITAVAFLAMTWTGLALAQSEPAPSGRTLVVYETAAVYAKPDMARLSFFIASTEPTVKNAREENDKQVKKVKDAITALKLDNIEVRVLPSATSNVVSQDANWPNVALPGAPGVPPVPPPANKQVQSSFHITIKEKDEKKLRQMVAKLADVTAENGGTASGSQDGFGVGIWNMMGGRAGQHTPGARIEWLVENYGEAQREAIKIAVKNAHANAQAAVGKAKVSVVKMKIGLKKDPSSNNTNTFINYVQPFQVAVTPESGLIPITVDVEVTFSY